jgi:hypothetical protein
MIVKNKSLFLENTRPVCTFIFITLLTRHLKKSFCLLQGAYGLKAFSSIQFTALNVKTLSETVFLNF